ncbi:DUF6518 family protein [Nocardioides sp. SYSU D00038]|uniref:DUF6518 family protein n=1 Tax=Nocardioides sp. SYSU D00038 TaxID=2812554 RepID=UPI001966F706|nr:DUF6518 family protein [Nocardioides sp. SYSU D00038]
MTTSTSLPTVPRPVPAPRPLLVWPVVLAAGAGVVLGVGDLWLQRQLSYPLAHLANSSAVWAVCAFVVGTLLPGRPLLGALCGAVVLVVATEAYYVAELRRLGLGWNGLAPDVLLRPHTLMWVGMGLVVGPVLGAAGAGWRRTTGWVAAGLLALPAGVLLGEAMLRDGAVAVLTAGLAAALVLAGSARLDDAARAALLTPAVGVAAWVAFHLAGFGWGG